MRVSKIVPFGKVVPKPGKPGREGKEGNEGKKGKEGKGK